MSSAGLGESRRRGAPAGDGSAVTTRELCQTLEQGRELVLALEPALFTLALPPGQSGVGAHVRHAADFVRAFALGVRAGRIDYDARLRDARVEREPARAAALLWELQAALEALGALDPHGSLYVRMEVAPGAGPEEGWHASSVGRELAFVLSHTIHHYALIALFLRQHGREPGAEFGVAPSTLAHWKARACATSAAS